MAIMTGVQIVVIGAQQGKPLYKRLEFSKVGAELTLEQFERRIHCTRVQNSPRTERRLRQSFRAIMEKAKDPH